jgi:hypothetical protein
VRRALKVSATMGILAGMLLVAGIPAGCGVSKSGIQSGAGGKAGVGGGTQGHGWSAGTGGSNGSGGTAGSTTGVGTGGSKGTGGEGTGGLATGGILTGTGGVGAGGAGTGGMVKGGVSGTTISGTGGMVKGGVGGTTISGTGGMVKGGVSGTIIGGTGGMLKGGATGSGSGGSRGTGGAPPLDGGTPDATAPKCSEVTTQAACDERNDCHSVFEAPSTCSCASPGCCTVWKTCADGDYANCTGPAACNSAQPPCQLPYVVAYKSLCYEGCVQQDDCAYLPCPQVAPNSGSACSSAYGMCYYEDCAGAGRALATCVAGSWQVQSEACSSFGCQAPDTVGGGLTCAAGQVCVVTTSTSFNVTPACVDQTCGTGPVSTTCIQDLSGSCSAKYRLGGLLVNCAMPVP